MMFKVPVQSLRKALSICSLAAAKPPSALANRVVISTFGDEEKRVEVASTDNSIQSRVWIGDIQGDSEEEFAMPIDKLTAMCRESEGDIEFDVDGDVIKVKSSAGKWSVPREVVAMSIKSVPEKSPFATITYDTLSKALRWVDFVANGTPAMNLAGVRLEVKRGQLLIVATDGRRLSFFRVDCECESEISCRVPLSVLKMAELLKADVKLRVDGSTTFFESAEGVVSGTELDGRYPNFSTWFKVYDKDDGCSLNPGELASAMRSVGIVTDSELKSSSIEPESGKLKMSSKSIFGESLAYCPIEGKDGPKGRFNYRFVEQAASALSTLHDGQAKAGMIDKVMYLRGGDFAHIIIGMVES